MNDLRFFGKLGEGSFAEVFKVFSHKRKKYYALKRLKKRYRKVDEVRNLPEVLALQALQLHPNIIKLEDTIYDHNTGSVYLLLELCDRNLFELIRDNHSPFEERVALTITYQLLKAVAYMHSKNMFHRDIKPENCMVNQDTLEVKLVDFGTTSRTTSTEKYTEYVSTRWYRAPECILTRGCYGMEVDEWAVGCMLFEILTTRPLFPGQHEIDQISKINQLLGSPAAHTLEKFSHMPNTQISFAFQKRPSQDLRQLLPSVSRATVELLGQLLAYDPSDRLKACDALNHRAFSFIRNAEVKWEHSDKRTPFPIYALTEAAAQLKANYAVRPPQEPMSMMISKLSVQDEKPPIIEPKKPSDTKLAESRMRAAQRIKEYQKKAKENNKSMPNAEQKKKIIEPKPSDAPHPRFRAKRGHNHTQP